MLNRLLRRCRSHPILAAALLGAIAGCINVIFIEIGAMTHTNRLGVLPLLFSSSPTGQRGEQSNALEAALLLLIEVTGNVLGFVLLFVIPVALIVVVRRLLRRKTAPLPDSES